MVLSKSAPEESIGSQSSRGSHAGALRIRTGVVGRAYETCLAHDLELAGLCVERQITLPIEYDGKRIDAGYRLDILVERSVVVEVKAVDKLMPIHLAQLVTCLKLGRYALGYLLNFNVLHMRQGIKRVVV